MGGNLAPYLGGVMAAGLAVISVLSALTACILALPFGMGAALCSALGFGCGAPILVVALKVIQFSASAAEEQTGGSFLSPE